MSQLLPRSDALYVQAACNGQAYGLLCDTLATVRMVCATETFTERMFVGMQLKY
jgi:hypothetical protein